MSWRDSKDLTVWKMKALTGQQCINVMGMICVLISRPENIRQKSIVCPWSDETNLHFDFVRIFFFLAPLISNLNRRLVGCRTESWAKRQRPVGTIYRACGASLRGCHQTLGGQGWLMEEIRKRSWDFWKRQSTKNKTRVGGFKSFQCRKFFGEDGIQVDEHIFQLADHGMPQVCCRHFKTL